MEVGVGYFTERLCLPYGNRIKLISTIKGINSHTDPFNYFVVRFMKSC